MRIRALLIGIAIAVLAVPLAAASRQLVLQIDPASLQKAEAGSDVIVIRVCSILHELSPVYCRNWHVDAIIPIAEAPVAKAGVRSLVGSKMVLKNASGQREQYRIDRVAPQYRLDSGAIFEPAKNWNPESPLQERWIAAQELAHGKRAVGRVVVDWRDVDGDGLVGARDLISFDNGESGEIADVLIGLHVTQVK